MTFCQRGGGVLEIEVTACTKGACLGEKELLNEEALSRWKELLNEERAASYGAYWTIHNLRTEGGPPLKSEGRSQ